MLGFTAEDFGDKAAIDITCGHISDRTFEAPLHCNVRHECFAGRCRREPTTTKFFVDETKTMKLLQSPDVKAAGLTIDDLIEMILKMRAEQNGAKECKTA